MDTQTPPLRQEKSKPKIIDTIPMLLVAVATLGPFALPLLWRNPRFSLKMKVGWSLAILIFTLWLLKFGKDMLENLIQELSISSVDNVSL